MADKNYKMVLIEWLDSKGVIDSWEFFEDIEPMPPVKIKSVGFLVDDHNEWRTIALSVSDEQMLGRLTIPSKCITKMTVLS